LFVLIEERGFFFISANGCTYAYRRLLSFFAGGVLGGGWRKYGVMRFFFFFLFFSVNIELCFFCQHPVLFFSVNIYLAFSVKI
jgi:hypothetical protein